MADVLPDRGQNESVRNFVRKGLTYALVLHPIAAALALIALIFAICSNVVSHIIGSLICFFAFLVTISEGIGAFSVCNTDVSFFRHSRVGHRFGPVHCRSSQL